MNVVTWHTAMIGAAVWALKRTQYAPATIKALGRKRVLVRFENGTTGFRNYGEIYGRRLCLKGIDKPVHQC